MKPVKVISVGRSHENDVVLSNDSKVSRHHCQLIKYDDGSCSVTDMGSSNGTFVNGQRISGVCKLNPQDTVTVGTTTLPWQNHLGVGTSGGGVPPKNGGASTGLIIGIIVAGVAILGLVLFLILGGTDKDGGSNGSDTTAGNGSISILDPLNTVIPGDKTNPGKKDTSEAINPDASAWCGRWENGDFVLEIRSVAKGKLVGGYVYASESHTDTGDEEDGFFNPVSGSINADLKTAVASFTSKSWGGKGKFKLTLRKDGKIYLKIISSTGQFFVPDEAILSRQGTGEVKNKTKNNNNAIDTVSQIDSRTRRTMQM